MNEQINTPAPAIIFPRNSGAQLYPGMIRYEGVGAMIQLEAENPGEPEGEIVIVAPSIELLERMIKHHGLLDGGDLDHARCKPCVIKPL